MKKLLSLLLCCALIWTSMQTVVFAEETEDSPLIAVKSFVEDGVLYINGTVLEAAAEVLTDGLELSVTLDGTLEKSATINEGKFAVWYAELLGTYTGLVIRQGKTLVYSSDKAFIVEPVVDALTDTVPLVDPADPVETPDPGVPVDPTDPADPVETPDPSVPVDPTDPAETPDTNAPVDPTPPVETPTPNAEPDEAQQVRVLLGAMPRSVAVGSIVIEQVAGGINFSGQSTKTGARLTVELLNGDGQVARTLPTPVFVKADGTFSGFFPLTGIVPGTYTLRVNDGESAEQGNVNEFDEPALMVDPIYDTSPIITGMTAPYLKVTMDTLVNNEYEKVTMLSNFRGAFYGAFSKPPRADWNVTFTIEYPYPAYGQKIVKVFGVNKGYAPTYPNDLRYGQSGPGVLAMQGRLYELGYPLTITGTFDSQTLEAVLAFQRINYLIDDGVAGPATRRLLFSVTARENVGNYDAAGVFRYGDRGVRSLQERLHNLKYYYGSIDDVFGRITENAVKAFERKHGLPVDGIADNVMQALLFSDSAKNGPGYTEEYFDDDDDDYDDADPTPKPTATPAPDVLAANELPVTSRMTFAQWDTVLEKALLRGTVRIETQSAYSLLDPTLPGMLMRVSYVDAQGKSIPMRVRWQGTEYVDPADLADPAAAPRQIAAGTFITRDVLRNVIADNGPSFIDGFGEVYWSLTPFMEAQKQTAIAAPPSIGQDNMIFWLNRPLMSNQAGKQWRVAVEILDPYSDTLQLDLTQIALILQDGGIVALDEAVLTAEQWVITKLPQIADGLLDPTPVPAQTDTLG